MSNLGPLQQLIGTWTGDQGVDVFITPDGKKITTKYKETMTFTEIPPTANPPFQTVYGLRYLTVLENFETGAAMHQETGYWLVYKDLFGGYTIIRTFSIPHGIAIMAGGKVDSADATEWTVSAKAGHSSYGILNSHYLEFMARTTDFTSNFKIDGNTLTYSEVSTLGFFVIDAKEHTDSNTLTKKL